MTFTYDDAYFGTTLNEIRSELGDTIENQGPLPDGRNLSDERIERIYANEGTVNGAVAHCMEILSREWASFALSERAKDASFDAKEVSDTWAERAAEARRMPDAGTGPNSALFRTKTE